VRTLFAYAGLPGGEGGAEARPDLASSWDVSPDALTWTFTIREGIRYGPPLEEVEVTANDFVRALLRTARAGGDDEYLTYSYYYSVIEGFDRYAAGEADTISGLETPDDHTLVVRLTEPASDLPDRLTLAASAPIPPNPYNPDALFGAAGGHDEDYGRFLVASGPYMIEGSDDLDLSLPAAQQTPIDGYGPPAIGGFKAVGPGSLTLVRNPSWDPATDEIRPAYSERIEIRIHAVEPGQGLEGLNEDLAAAVDAGEADHVIDIPSPSEQTDRYATDPALASRLWTGAGGQIWYLWMNVAVPPFDDLHVRRAAAFAIDEEELVRSFRAHGWEQGPASPEPHTHIVPDPMEAELLATYDPYPTDLDLAKAEMALSRYDRREDDGVCDACPRVVAVTFDSLPEAITALVAEQLAPIGVRVRFVHVPFPDFVRRVYHEGRRTPMTLVGWAADHLNPSTFFTPLFTSEALHGSGSNPTMLGASPDQLEAWGYEVDSVPSVDDRVDRCMSTVGSEQLECWVGLDRYLMEQIVPVVPFMQVRLARLVSARVESFSFDQFTGQLAYDRIALVRGSE
jgi:peptide/nickel transport system substrate-binding protein